MTFYNAAAGQGISGIHFVPFRRAVNTVPFVIKNNDMEIYFMPLVIAQDEIPRAGVVSLDIYITLFFH
jgi:hypothetical protein